MALKPSINDLNELLRKGKFPPADSLVRSVEGRLPANLGQAELIRPSRLDGPSARNGTTSGNGHSPTSVERNANRFDSTAADDGEA